MIKFDLEFIKKKKEGNHLIENQGLFGKEIFCEFIGLFECFCYFLIKNLK